MKKKKYALFTDAFYYAGDPVQWVEGLDKRAVLFDSKTDALREAKKLGLDENYMVAVVSGRKHVDSIPIVKDAAHTLLLLAAPEMLKALKNLTSGEVNNAARKKYWEQARAVIAKAEGKES